MTNLEKREFRSMALFREIKRLYDEKILVRNIEHDDNFTRFFKEANAVMSMVLEINKFVSTSPVTVLEEDAYNEQRELDEAEAIEAWQKEEDAQAVREEQDASDVEEGRRFEDERAALEEERMHGQG